MKLKIETVILAVLIVVLSAYLILRNPNRSHYQLPTQPEIKRTAFDKIEITSARGTIKLTKKDDQWRIEPQGFPVEKSAVDRMLDALQRITLTALVSEAKDYGRYELDEAKRIAVKAWADGTPVRDFQVGKTASSLRQTFLKLAGDDRVYQAQGNIQASFDKSVDDLRDKLVLSFDSADIQSLAIDRDGKTLVLNRQETTPAERPKQPADSETKSETKSKTKTKVFDWQTADGRKADRTKVQELLNNLSHLRCDGYLDEKAAEGLKDPVYSVTAKGGKEYHLALFQKLSEKATAYPATSSANDYPFLLPEWRAKQIMQSPEDLLPQEEKTDSGADKKAASGAEPVPAAKP